MVGSSHSSTPASVDDLVILQATLWGGYQKRYTVRLANINIGCFRRGLTVDVGRA
jgi:hypothetical protein